MASPSPPSPSSSPLTLAEAAERIQVPVREVAHLNDGTARIEYVSPVPASGGSIDAVTTAAGGVIGAYAAAIGEGADTAATLHGVGLAADGSGDTVEWRCEHEWVGRFLARELDAADLLVRVLSTSSELDVVDDRGDGGHE